jgi:hypothetical protein
VSDLPDAVLTRVLASNLARDELAVYGDYLQSRGDPRGELIAIDLADDPALADRRRVLEVEWLAPLPTPLHVSGRSRFGFAELEITTAEQLVVLLAGPIAPFVRTLAIQGAAHVIADAVPAFTGRMLPALASLEIHHTSDIPSKPIVTSHHADKLIAATPRLARLHVNGRRVFGHIDHPNVTALVISGLDAIDSLSGTGPPLARITDLDFAFHRHALLDHLPPPNDLIVRSLLPKQRWPNVRRLDLSRNEPGSRSPHSLGGQVDVFGWLRALMPRPLERLRLPSLRSEQQLADLAAAIASLPADCVIEIARAYTGSPPPPPRVSAPPPRPWPPRDQVHGRDALWVTIEGAPYSEDLDLSGIVEYMEFAFDALPADARDAWSEFWDFLSDLGWEDANGNDITMLLSSDVLVRALEPADLDDHRRWADLRTLLRQIQPLPATVSVKRYWGW